MARPGTGNVTRNPKLFHVLECQSWKREIGIVQRFYGIYWLFVHTRDVTLTMIVSRLDGPSVVGLGQLTVSRLIVRFARFFSVIIAGLIRHGV